MTMLQEPLIHSHITDILPEWHPLAFGHVFCDKCKESLHASNNECMQTWIESGAGNHCMRCFYLLADGDAAVLEDELGLKTPMLEDVIT